MTPSCVLARLLTEARVMLDDAGVQVAGVTETVPPTRVQGGGPLRVVRTRCTPEGLHLTVAVSVALAEDDVAHLRI